MKALLIEQGFTQIEIIERRPAPWTGNNRMPGSTWRYRAEADHGINSRVVTQEVAGEMITMYAYAETAQAKRRSASVPLNVDRRRKFSDWEAKWEPSTAELVRYSKRIPNRSLAAMCAAVTTWCHGLWQN